MDEKEARETIDLWNKVPPKDFIERDARWVSVNQAVGFLAGVEAERRKITEILSHFDRPCPTYLVPCGECKFCENKRLVNKILAAYAQTEGGRDVWEY